MTPAYHEFSCAEARAKRIAGEFVPDIEICGGTYTCSVCGRTFGWCHGGHSDDDDDLLNGACDECWLSMTTRREAKETEDA